MIKWKNTFVIRPLLDRYLYNRQLGEFFKNPLKIAGHIKRIPLQLDLQQKNTSVKKILLLFWTNTFVIVFRR
jgi:hypothetical protein